MQIQQISVFVENKPGRLADITETLAQGQVNIRAVSVADTSDFGILRLIVDKPQEAVRTLRGSGAHSVFDQCDRCVYGGYARFFCQNHAGPG